MEHHLEQNACSKPTCEEDRTIRWRPCPPRASEPGEEEENISNNDRCRVLGNYGAKCCLPQPEEGKRSLTEVVLFDFDLEDGVGVFWGDTFQTQQRTCTKAYVTCPNLSILICKSETAHLLGPPQSWSPCSVPGIMWAV